jgi:hypothetical protein
MFIVDYVLNMISSRKKKDIVDGDIKANVGEV